MFEVELPDPADVRRLGDGALAAAITEGARVAAAAEARTAVAVAELVRRRVIDEHPDWSCDDWDACAAEVACALSVSHGRASGLMDDAITLRDKLPEVGARYLAGHLGTRAVSTICNRTGLVTDAAALAAIDYAPVACVASAYARADVAHALDGFGCLVPRLEQRRVLGVLFTSSMFEGRAPAGQVLLSSFIGGRRQSELAALPEAEIAALAHDENAALLGARHAPLWQAVTRWPRAIPQYERGHLARVAEVAKAEAALPGLRLCANWRDGVSLGDCIVQGGRAAREIAEALRSGR